MTTFSPQGSLLPVSCSPVSWYLRTGHAEHRLLRRSGAFHRALRIRTKSLNLTQLSHQTYLLLPPEQRPSRLAKERLPRGESMTLSKPRLFLCCILYFSWKNKPRNLPPAVPIYTRVTPTLPCFMKGRQDCVIRRLQVPFKDLTHADKPEESEPGKEVDVANFQASHTTLKNIFPCVCWGGRKSL